MVFENGNAAQIVAMAAMGFTTGYIVSNSITRVIGVVIPVFLWCCGFCVRDSSGYPAVPYVCLVFGGE